MHRSEAPAMSLEEIWAAYARREIAEMKPLRDRLKAGATFCMGSDSPRVFRDIVAKELRALRRLLGRRPAHNRRIGPILDA